MERERRNVYQELEDLAQALRAAGADFWSDQLEVAMGAGSTGTEILVDLHHVLESLERRPSGVADEHRGVARSIRREIRRILRPGISFRRSRAFIEPPEQGGP